MRRFWKRLVRLADQSRISIPRATLTADDIHPGDWVQIESRVWRIRRCSQVESGAQFELVSPRGNALLKEGVSSWTLYDSIELPIPTDSIIFYRLSTQT